MASYFYNAGSGNNGNYSTFAEAKSAALNALSPGQTATIYLKSDNGSTTNKGTVTKPSASSEDTSNTQTYYGGYASSRNPGTGSAQGGSTTTTYASSRNPGTGSAQGGTSNGTSGSQQGWKCPSCGRSFPYQERTAHLDWHAKINSQGASWQDEAAAIAAAGGASMPSSGGPAATPTSKCYKCGAVVPAAELSEHIAYKHPVASGGSTSTGRALPSAPKGWSESMYLKRYPDVAAAVKSGGFSSGLQHYLLHGQGEGRQGNFIPKFFDENAYLKANPDVAAAVKNGGMVSGLDHFLKYGGVEGRNGTFVEGIIDNMIANNDKNGDGKLTPEELGNKIWLQYSDKARADGVVTRQEAIDLVKQRVASGIHISETRLGGGKTDIAINKLMGQDQSNFLYSVDQVQNKLGVKLPNWIAQDGKVSETELGTFISNQVKEGNLEFTSSGSVQVSKNSKLTPLNAPDPKPTPLPQPVATVYTPATRGGSTSPNETKKSDPAKKPDEELPEEEKKLLKDFHEHMERLGLGFNSDGSIDFSGTKGQDPDEVKALHEEYDSLTPNEKKILAATYDPDVEGVGSLPVEPEVELSGSLPVESEELDEIGKGALPGSSGEVRTQSDNPQAIEARKAAIESRLERIAAQRQPWKNGPAKIADGTSDMVPPPIAGGAAKNNGLPTQQ